MCIEDILFLLPTDIKKRLYSINTDDLKELRIRVNQMLLLRFTTYEKFIEITCTKKHIDEILLKASNYSFYAFEEEIKQGFITTQTGIRIGICGELVMEGESIKTIINITSLNIRIPHAKRIDVSSYLKYLKEGEKLLNTIIVAPPGYGKTTFLRELIKYISDEGKNICVIDERMEIATIDLGKKSDVFLGGNKKKNIIMAIRTMSPDIIAFDEINPNDELKEIEYGLTCGLSFITTIHGKSIEDIDKKGILHLFQRYIILDNSYPFNLKEIYNNEGMKVYVRN